MHPWVAEITQKRRGSRGPPLEGAGGLPRIANEPSHFAVHRRSRLALAGRSPGPQKRGVTSPRYRLRPDLALLAVRGDDARAWLNGQITNDVRTTAAGEAVHALVLNTKGRILADVVAIDRGARGLAMVIPASEHEVLRTHLEKYVIMEDVTLELEAVALASAIGVDAQTAARAEAERYETPWAGEGACLLVGSGPLGARLDAVGASAIGEDAWELTRLRDGRPAFGADFGATTYPQEAGLDSAVSFKKGCYLGQEVVCMLESRGQLSRQLTRLALDVAVAPGAHVVDEEGHELGAITSAAVAPEGGAWALAYVKRAALAGDKPLRVGDQPARVLGPARG
jgi:folate-binding protein YgfZ